MSSPQAVAPTDQYGLPAGLSSEEGEFDPLLFLAVGLLFDIRNIPLGLILVRPLGLLCLPCSFRYVVVAVAAAGSWSRS